MISTFFISHSCLIILPISALICRYTTCRRYFGANTIWYLQFHFVCDKLPLSFAINGSPPLLLLRLPDLLSFYSKGGASCILSFSLSPAPLVVFFFAEATRKKPFCKGFCMVEVTGFEPATFWSRTKSNLLILLIFLTMISHRLVIMFFGRFGIISGL